MSNKKFNVIPKETIIIPGVAVVTVSEIQEEFFTDEMHRNIFVFPDGAAKRSSTGNAVMNPTSLIPITKKSQRARGAIRTANF